jgi:hypothetical protein
MSAEHGKRSPSPSSTEKRPIEDLEQVSEFQHEVDLSGVDEKKLLRKIDMRLIPWLSLLYLLSFIDRVSIG